MSRQDFFGVERGAKSAPADAQELILHRIGEANLNVRAQQLIQAEFGKFPEHGNHRRERQEQDQEDKPVQRGSQFFSFQVKQYLG